MDQLEQLTAQVKWIASIAERSPDSAALERLRARAADALARARNAAGTGQEPPLQLAASEIATIERDVQALVVDLLKCQPSSASWTSWFGIGAMAAVVFGVGWTVHEYMDASGVTALSRIDGMRPVLVLAATISTIVFGGALLLGSLFSAEGTLDERFRRAREIFLVFSGVFGTVIGFYFGAGESRARLGIDATLDATQAVLSAYASGGVAPYVFTAAYGPNSQKKTFTSTDGFATFTFDKASDQVIPLSVSATDSRGERGEKVLQLDAASLREQKWSLTDKPSEPAAGGAKPPAQSPGGAKPPASPAGGAKPPAPPAGGPETP